MAPFSSTSVKRFMAADQAEYHHGSEGVFPVLGYDAMKLMASEVVPQAHPPPGR